LGTTPECGNKRLTATVQGLSHIAHDLRPSIEVCSSTAHSFPFCDAVEHGITVTVPLSVRLRETIITGRLFQNSGNCASFGKSHQYRFRVFGAAFNRGAIFGGVLLLSSGIQNQ
jgi:hypothetical protein